MGEMRLPRNFTSRWPMVRIGEYCEVVTGGTPSTKKSEYWEHGDIPWLTSESLRDADIETSSKSITKLGLKNSSARIMPTNSVLIALTGATTGRVGYLRFNSSANQSVTGIMAGEKVHPRYLFYWLKSIRWIILEQMWGGGQPHISQAYVKSIQFPLAPYNEQKKIASMIDKANDINDSSNKTNEMGEKLIRSLFLELFGDPILNQRGFPLTTLSNVCEVISGFAFKSAEYSENSSHINLVRGQNISHGFLDWKLGKYWEKMDDSIEKYQLLEGDIVLAMDRPIISTGLKISEIKNTDLPALLVQRVARIRSSTLPPSFIMALLKHPIFTRKIESSKTETTIPHITLRNVKELQFPLPPPELLEEFSKILNLFKEITSHSQERISTTENVMKSIIQEMLT